MPENIRHYRKFATEMLRKLDLGNPPNVTGEVKDDHHRRPAGSSFRGQNPYRKPPHRNLTETQKLTYFESYVIIGE